MITSHIYSQHTDSTETSILKLACDALLAADLGNVTLLGLFICQLLLIPRTTKFLLVDFSRRLVSMVQFLAGSHPSLPTERRQ